MRIGVLSDTHSDKMNAIPHIMDRFRKSGVELIIHCGDISRKHLKPELFGGLPVVCAMVEEQLDHVEFQTPPENWAFTRPGQRIHRINSHESVYVGHKLSFEFLTGSEAKLAQKLAEIRRDHDGVRWLFSGHTHHQIFKQGRLISFVNPGAVEDSYDGYEFAIVDTDTEEIVFSRIPRVNPQCPPFSVGVISDSFTITQTSPNFWTGLRDELKRRGVSHIIHCGNISPADIGRPELSDFMVLCNLREDQQAVKNAATNWQQIPLDNPVVEINGYRFYVQLDLGAALVEKSEFDMHMLCLGLRRKYPEINFVLCGFTHEAFLEEGEQVRIINPGNIINDEHFAVIFLPSNEITFGCVPVPPLPKL